MAMRLVPARFRPLAGALLGLTLGAPATAAAPPEGRAKCAARSQGKLHAW